MDESDLFAVEPRNQFFGVKKSVVVVGHARSAARAEWNKDVAQRAVESWRKDLAYARVRTEAECLNLPANEMVDSLQTSGDCFRLPRRA